MSQTLTPPTKIQTIHDIERIKALLIERKTQAEIAEVLKVRRETVNRKIQQWMQTPDFEVWLKTAWMEAHAKVDDATAYEALTKILCRMVTRKAELKEEYVETVTHTTNINYSEEEKLAIVNARRIIRDKEGSAVKLNSLH